MARLRDLILADSPVGYWPLDDTDYTRVADISGNAYHGSFVGAPALNQLGPTDAQPCMVFNGTADGITLPSGAIVGATSPKTLMGLFNIDWSSDTKNRPLIFQGKSAGSTVFSIHAGFPGRSTTDTGNNFLFSLQNNSSNYGVGGNLRTYLANRWMLAAATYTGSVLNLYAGVLQPNPRLSLVASTLYAMSGRWISSS